MNRIRIDERDFTTPILNTYDNEIAYVPGFATLGPVDEPILCSSVAEFLSTFATLDSERNYVFPTYNGDQSYPSTTVVTPSCTVETTISDGEVSHNDQAFYEKVQTAGQYVFTASVSSGDTTWSLQSSPVDLQEYGLEVTSGTVANNNTITVTLTTSEETTYAFPPEAVPTGGFWAEDGDIDPSFLYAIGLLSVGIQVIYERMNTDNTDITVAQAYNKLTNYFMPTSAIMGESTLLDKSTYNIKYITSGGYPTYEYSASIADNMITIAATRGDCIALIDHTNNSERTLSGASSVINSVRTNSFGNSFSTMFTPWGNFATPYGSCDLPGSYAYLTALGRSNQTNDSWLAIAGIARGGVSNLTNNGILTEGILTNTIAENMGYNNEDICINPITKINGAQTIWGNRTLKKNSNGATATSFLNIRNLVCDVKKQAYTAAKAAIFEPNDDVLWLNFKSSLTPLLDRMVTGRGLTSYKIIRNANADPTKLDATIKLYPIYSVEAVDIYVELHDDDTVTTTE